MAHYRKEVYRMKNGDFISANGYFFGIRYVAWTYWGCKLNEDGHRVPVRKIKHIAKISTSENLYCVDLFYPDKTGFVSLNGERCQEVDGLADFISSKKEDPERGVEPENPVKPSRPIRLAA